MIAVQNGMIKWSFLFVSSFHLIILSTVYTNKSILEIEQDWQQILVLQYSVIEVFQALFLLHCMKKSI